MTTLHTQRLVLRPWQRADLDIMAKWPPFPDPLDAMWNWPRTLHEQGTTDLFFLTRQSDSSRREWVISTNQTVVGYLHLRSIDPNKRTARLGIGFGYPYMGQGYGYEMLQAFLAMCFSTLGLRSIQLDVATFNARARQLYHKLGFEPIATTWRPLGVTADTISIDAPAYRMIRPFLRVEGSQVYALSVEMMLAAEASFTA